MMRKLLFLLFILALSGNVFAFGVGTPYLENKTLYLAPNESYRYILELQNGDDFPVRAKVVMTDNQIIAFFENLQTHYDLQPKTYKTEVPVIIKIPESAAFFTKYAVSYIVSVEPLDNKEGVAFGINLPGNINIEVREKTKQTEESNTKFYWFLLLALVLAAFLVRKKLDRKTILIT